MKILIIDDHPLFREGILPVVRRIDEDVEIFDATDFRSAMRHVEGNPDLSLILLDLELPDIHGLNAIEPIKQKLPDCPIIIISGMEDPFTVTTAIKKGAKGYIPKSSASETTLHALGLVLSGSIYIPPMALEVFERSANRNSTLSPRQQEILNLLAQGKSNKHIANLLTISEGTVRTHIATIFKLLSVNNRTEAVHAAKKMNLLN